MRPKLHSSSGIRVGTFWNLTRVWLDLGKDSLVVSNSVVVDE